MLIRLEGGWVAFGLGDLCGDVMGFRYTRAPRLLSKTIGFCGTTILAISTLAVYLANIVVL